MTPEYTQKLRSMRDSAELKDMVKWQGDAINRQAKQIEDLNSQFEVSNHTLCSEYRKNYELTAFISSQDKHILEQAKQIEELKAHVGVLQDCVKECLNNQMDEVDKEVWNKIYKLSNNTPAQSLAETRRSK